MVMPLKHSSGCAFEETTNSWLKVQQAVPHARRYLGTFSPRGSDTTAPDLSPLLFFSQSSVCSKIVQLLGQNEVDYRQKQVVIVSQDSFYRVLTSEQKSKALKGQFNFDHPGEWRTAPGPCRGTGSGVGAPIPQAKSLAWTPGLCLCMGQAGDLWVA